MPATDLALVAGEFFACSFVQKVSIPTPPITATASNRPMGDQRCEDREADRFGDREVERVRRFFLAIESCRFSVRHG
ncbi:hypothetical protein [Phyllobacterium sp. K27]